MRTNKLAPGMIFFCFTATNLQCLITDKTFYCPKSNLVFGNPSSWPSLRSDIRIWNGSLDPGLSWHIRGCTTLSIAVIPKGKKKWPSDYHAHRVKSLLGHFLTQYFLVSSRNKTSSPNAIGRKKFSTGTWDVPRVFYIAGIYNQKKAITSANSIAGKRYKFCVAILNNSGWRKILSLRVYMAIKLNHCMITRLIR